MCGLYASCVTLCTLLIGVTPSAYLTGEDKNSGEQQCVRKAFWTVH